MVIKMNTKSNKISIGIDVGGTKLAIALVDEFGKLLAKKTVYDHIDKKEDDFIKHIYLLADDLLRENSLKITDIDSVGLCFPGHIRFKEGVVITTSNLNGFKNYPLRNKLKEHFGTNIIIDNDANCQAYAEYKFGTGKGFDDLIFITVSTGIGGGIIINNKLYRGMTGTAGEFGHMVIEHNSTSACTCNNKGCWMACSCGMFLNRSVKKHLEKGVQSNFITLDDVNSGRVDGKMIKLGLDQNDSLCETVVSEYADYIGTGLNNIFQIFNPPLVVLGGGLMKLGEKFLNQIRNNFNNRVKGMMHDEMQIRLTELDGNAGVIGAAAIAMNEK